MLLAIDLGNTTTVFGLFQRDRLVKVRRLPSERQVLEKWGRGSKKPWRSIDGIIISSVVPSLNKTLTSLAIRKGTGKKPVFVRAGLKMPIRLRVPNPRRIGADRIVNAVAAHALYQGKGVRLRQTPLLVIDFGTATTFDVVNAEGDFIGGAIAPGLKTMGEALFEKCALLPAVSLQPPGRVVGKTTQEAMRSGIFFGYAGLVDSLVDRIQKELGRRCRVIATGGLACRIAPLTKTISKVDPDLTLKGLSILHSLNISSCDT